MSRLTTEIRNKICNSLINHRFREEALSICDEIKMLAHAVYDDVFTEIERKKTDKYA